MVYLELWGTYKSVVWYSSVKLISRNLNGIKIKNGPSVPSAVCSRCLHVFGQQHLQMNKYECKSWCTILLIQFWAWLNPDNATFPFMDLPKCFAGRISLYRMHASKQYCLHAALKALSETCHLNQTSLRLFFRSSKLKREGAVGIFSHRALQMKAPIYPAFLSEAYPQGHW